MTLEQLHQAIAENRQAMRNALAAIEEAMAIIVTLRTQLRRVGQEPEA